MADRRFAERLAEAMRSKGVSQRALARAVGVTPAAARKWLRGTVPRETLLALCALQLGVDPVWLAEGTHRKDVPATSRRQQALLRTALLLWQRKQIAKARTELRDKIEEHLKLNKQLRDEGFESLPAFERPMIEIAETLDDITEKRYEAHMPPKAEEESIEQLVDDVKRLTTVRGSRAKLARMLNVRPQRLNEWLNQKQVPRGGISLLLREWVRAEELRQKRDPEAAQTAPGQATQLQKSSYENPKVRSKKASHKGTKRSTVKRRKR